MAADGKDRVAQLEFGVACKGAVMKLACHLDPEKYVPEPFTARPIPLELAQRLADGGLVVLWELVQAAAIEADLSPELYERIRSATVKFTAQEDKP